MTFSIDAGGELRDLPSLLDRSGADATDVAATLVDTVKALATSVPTPRFDPFYGIDRAGGPSLAAVELLSRHGDFRKYVHVLDVRAGAGGPARWLSLRYGCRVLALDPRPAVARVANTLSRRAGLRGRVTAVAGTTSAIPARDGVFTQIWCLDALDGDGDPVHALAEMHRVLRPGSPLALQVRVDDDAAGDAGAPTPACGGTVPARRSLATYRDVLAAVGFSGIEDDDVTDVCAEGSPVVLSARARFAAVLHERGAVPTATNAVTPAARGQRVVQLFARRPST